MRLVRGYPPIIKQITAVFPQARKVGVVFAMGDTIYFTATTPPPRSVIEHEEAHGERQRNDGVAQWWGKYLSDFDFRFAEELIGHRAEWSYFKRHYPAHECVRYLNDVARKLSGPLYNNMCSFEDALELLEAA